MKNKLFLKNHILLVIGGIFSIVTPIVLSSCSTISTSNNTNNNNNNGNNNNNNGNQNNNNNSNENNGNDGFLDKDKNPELFVSKHIFSYDELITKTPLEIHQSTPLYKSSLKNLEFLLKKENIDSSNIISDELKAKLNDWYKEIGIIGEIGNDDKEKVRYTPTNFDKDKVLTQKYVESINEESGLNISQLSFGDIKDKVNEVILNNPFGYLPSNLNQMLYYLNINDISKLFKIDNLKEIFINHDDKLGVINIYFRKNDGGIFKLLIDSTNSNIKKNHDFLQYIFDRTFSISANFWKFEPGTLDRYNFYLSKKGSGGSVWIIDRIVNETLPENTYEFLIGTNLHVLDFSPFFEKTNKINKIWNKYWDGGFRDFGEKNSSPPGMDNVKKLLPKDDSDIIGFVEVLDKKREDTSPIYMRMATNSEKDVSKIDPNLTTQKNDYDMNIEWGSNKYIDLIWYTPSFTSSGVRSTTSGGVEELLFGKKIDGDRIGTILDGGADFAVAKIKLKKSQIDKLLPKLGNVLGTEKEKDWYMGLGKQEKIISNQTVFIGGYPEYYWNSSKSIGGRIRSKNRHVTFNDDSVPYWTKFDSEINKEKNERFGTVKENEDNHQPYYKGVKNRTFEHGMKLRKIVQNSILNTSAEDVYLQKGASGSMAIDSKFNLVGFLFNGLGSYEDPMNFFTNGIGLMDSLSTYDNWDGSIRNDILKKIKSENLYTIKINPKQIKK